MLLQQFVITLFQISACCLRALLVLRSLCLQLSFGFVTFGASLVQEFDQTRAFVVEEWIARRDLDPMRSCLRVVPILRLGIHPVVPAITTMLGRWNWVWPHSSLLKSASVKTLPMES